MLQIHYIRVSFVRSILFIGLALVALVACSSEPDDSGNPPGTSSGSGGIVDGVWPFDDSSGENLAASPGLDGLELENVIEIEYKNGSDPEITNPFSDVAINKDGENVVVRIESATEYSFVLSGTAKNGSIKFYGDVRKRLYLNGVSITNSKGPAINIQKSGRIIVHLVNGTQNFLSDAPGYICTNFKETEEEEQAKGAFFSEGKLNFEGSGSLEVKGKCNHAIVADNDIEVSNGKITVSESVNDGIHANDIIQVSGGVLKVTSKGDAIQSERETGKVVVTGGKIKAATTDPKSHGIASEGPTSISGNAIIQISVFGNGSKGIRSRGWVEFKDNAKTSIKTSGTKHTDPADPEDESNASGIKLAAELFVEGGELTIKSIGDGAKGINAINAKISAGKIDIEANDDGLRVHGTLKIEGGTGSIKSSKKKAIDADVWDNNKGSITTQDGVS